MQKITDTISKSGGGHPDSSFGPNYVSFSQEEICKAFLVPANLPSAGPRLVNVTTLESALATPATEPSTPSDIGYCRDAEVRRVYLG